MSGYRRFVAYVYEYQKGKKGSNCGFIKVEVRDQRCSMEVHLHCSGLTPQVECKIYGFVRKDGLMNGILLGSCETEEDTAECLIETDSLNMGGSGISLGRMGGMVLVTDLGGFFGTEWDDQPIRPENFREIKVPEETKSQKSVNARMESDKKESAKNEGDYTDEKSAQPDLEAEESRQDVQERENDSEEEFSDGRDREVLEGPVEAAPDKSDASADFEAETQGGNEAEENIADRQQREAAIKNVTQGESYAGFEKDAVEEYEDNVEDAENVMVEEEHGEDEEFAKNAAVKKEYAESEENAAAEKKYVESEQNPVTDVTYRESEENDGSENNDIDNESRAATEEQYANGSEEAVGTKQYVYNGGAAGTRKEFVPEQGIVEMRPPNQFMTPPRPAQNTPPRPMQNTPPRPAQNTPPRPAQNTPPRTAQGVPPVPPRTNRSGNSGAMRKRVSFGEPFAPFSDGELVRCWKIQPQDFAYFPRRECALRNNRFLLYGYYNFGHLLLGKKPNGQYILGVPGGYDQQERFMANMFGFSYFKESRLIELPKARGGYWYRLINAPDFH